MACGVAGGAFPPEQVISGEDMVGGFNAVEVRVEFLNEHGLGGREVVDAEDERSA